MPLDEIKKCSECGYDMRGLQRGTPCPECGSQGLRHTQTSSDYKDSKLLRFIDSNLTVQGLLPVPDIRSRLRIWMRVAGLIVIIVAALQILISFAVIPKTAYYLCLFMLSFSWPFVVMGMMPSSVDASMPPIYKKFRIVVPYTQWAWVGGFALWLLSDEGSPDNFIPSFMLHLIAGVGWAGLSFWLHDLALRLDLDSTAWRCNVIATLICTWGLLVFLLPLTLHDADRMVGGGITMLWYFYILFFVGPWICILLLFAKSLFDFASISAWSLKYDKDVDGRQERVTQKWNSYEEGRKSDYSEN